MKGAHIAGCKQIIAVDKNQARIDIAIAQFGATHGLNTSGLEDLTAAMKHIAGGRGPNIVVESKQQPANLGVCDADHGLQQPASLWYSKAPTTQQIHEVHTYKLADQQSQTTDSPWILSSISSVVSSYGAVSKAIASQENSSRNSYSTIEKESYRVCWRPPDRA